VIMIYICSPIYLTGPTPTIIPSHALIELFFSHSMTIPDVLIHLIVFRNILTMLLILLWPRSIVLSHPPIETFPAFSIMAQFVTGWTKLR